ncbi:MAG: NADAR family protein [Marinifilaceae bacterium]|jgi:ribA/ribD-fused uncharacterized protein|nr:NADAR family protein [Marinifilaceae bacterium]
MNQKYNIGYLIDIQEKQGVIDCEYFWGHTKNKKQKLGNFCFSQWYESSFVVNGRCFKTTEHWMMANKALLFENYEIYEQIIDCDSPKDVKFLGRKVIGFDEHIWNEMKYEIVLRGNIHKFNQNPELGKYLQSTANKPIVEASPVDKIWGVGLAKDNKNITDVKLWKGLNLLGFALMEVRDFLNEFGYFSETETDLQTPWTKFYAKKSTDLFWQTKEAEKYIAEFKEEFNTFTNREKMIYQLYNPEQYNWQGFYKSSKIEKLCK